jgi:mannose/cellobiose epimerase-like protein (N-acyl-D-glucosamine 2-epimerase family)
VGGSASGGNSTGGSGTGGTSTGGSGGESYVPLTGGYVIRAPMLLAPNTAIAHATRTADFYATAADAQAGGFFTFLDRQAHPTQTNKSFIVESRDAYAFVRAFMLTGDKHYLALARQALDFLYAHGWDQARDGFIFLGDRQGNRLADPSGSQSPKWSFTQHYGLVGITAMCEATRSALDCGWMDKGASSLDRHMWDAVPGREGYFNNASNDFSSVSGKGFTPTVDGITTHVLYQYLVTGAAADRARVVALADEAASHLVGSMTAPGVNFGFPEDFNNDWSINTGSTYGFVGHLFKTSWVLARAYMATGNGAYRQAARQVLSQMWSRGGFDRASGAPNYDYHWTSGVGSTDKEYWQLEQGFTSGITNWFIADNDADRATFLEMADRTLDFYMSHLIDPQGGIFFQVNADGSNPVRTDKGDQWEGCYHDVELSYFVYLDGNLLLWHRPVTLYYDLESAAIDRSWILSPLPVVDGRIVITSVRLDGNPYSNFVGSTRRLDVPAGKGGVFAVTYAYVAP